MYTILLQQWYGVLTAADLAYWDRLLCLVRSIEEGIFQEDDPSPHITQASWAFLEEEEIELLPWPPRFIAYRKGVGYMGKFIDDLPCPPTTLGGELQGAVAEAWEATPQEFIDNAIASMPRRTQDCKP
jgi:hypothetical protein